MKRPPEARSIFAKPLRWPTLKAAFRLLWLHVEVFGAFAASRFFGAAVAVEKNDLLASCLNRQADVPVAVMGERALI